MPRIDLPSAIGRQRGATVLFVTVVVLLITMVLGITVGLLSGTQFKLAGNLQHENVAFTRAEGSTATAQSWLTTGANFKNPGFAAYAGATTPHLYPIGGFTGDPLAMTWNDGNSLAIGGDDAQRYFIEKIAACQSALGSSAGRGGRINAPIDRADLFRVTARGQSVKGTTKFVQIIYVIPISAADITDGHCGPLP